MRPTIPVLVGWNPGAMLGEAAKLTTAAAALEASADDLMRDFDTTAAGWFGDAADRARERVGGERTALVTLADAWTAGARVLDSGAVTIANLRGRVVDLVTAAQNDGLQVDSEGGVDAGSASDGLIEWIKRVIAAAQFAFAIKQALAAVDQADRDTALALATATGGTPDPAAMLEGAPALAEGAGEPGGEPYVIGPPTRPEITWDEDYIYNSEDATFDDWKAAAAWKAKMAGARLLRWDLDDSLDAYGHYWSNTGDTFEIDYEEAYSEDEGIRANVDEEIGRAQAGAETLISSGNAEFSMSGDAFPTSAYPVTENWQKTVGGYQQWSSADVTVVGNTVTMTVTVHAEDYYNFNRGQADIASGAPDDANGRFTEIGWAKPFETTGTITRTVTWELGSADEATVVKPESDSRGGD